MCEDMRIFLKKQMLNDVGLLVTSTIAVFFDTVLPLPIRETSGGDSSRNVNLDTGHNVLEPEFDFKHQPCRIQTTKVLNQNSILKKPAVPACAVFPAGHRAL